jgi:hypothetical protein
LVEVRDWKVGKGGVGGKVAEMTQTLNEHMNKRKKKENTQYRKQLVEGLKW